MECPEQQGCADVVFLLARSLREGSETGVSHEPHDRDEGSANVGLSQSPPDDRCTEVSGEDRAVQLLGPSRVRVQHVDR